MGSSKPKARRPRKKQSKGQQLPLKPGTITKESSCSTCRIRKVRCTGERPACALCIKGAAAQGLPASGVRCVFSGASALATREDKEFEAQAGGRGAKCRWGDEEERKAAEEVKGDEAAGSAQPQEVEELSEDGAENEDEGRATSPLSQGPTLLHVASPSSASSSPSQFGFASLRLADQHGQHSHFSPPPSPLPSFDLPSFNVPIPSMMRFANTVAAPEPAAAHDPLLHSLLTPSYPLSCPPLAPAPPLARADYSSSSMLHTAQWPVPRPPPTRLPAPPSHAPPPAYAYGPAPVAQPVPFPQPSFAPVSNAYGLPTLPPAPFPLDLAFADPHLPAPPPFFSTPAPPLALQLDTSHPLTFDALSSAHAFSPTAYLASTPLEPLPFPAHAQQLAPVPADEPYSFSMFRADPWHGLQMPPFETGGGGWSC
ncbi:hypothetical protein JCM10449v2_005559 [Rhodotorula kratochvilovae]